MIVMGVTDQDEVDGREIEQGNAGVTHALDDSQPVCPVWIDEDVLAPHLHDEGSVTDPGDPDDVDVRRAKIRCECLPFPGREQ